MTSKKPVIIPDTTALARFESVVSVVWGGWSHVGEPKWRNPITAEFEVFSGCMSTFDFNNLTCLVVACHDHCVRGEVRGGPRLRVMLSLRHNGLTNNPDVDSHPSIEQHISAIREGRDGYQKMYDAMRLPPDA